MKHLYRDINIQANTKFSIHWRISHIQQVNKSKTCYKTYFIPNRKQSTMLADINWTQSRIRSIESEGTTYGDRRMHKCNKYKKSVHGLYLLDTK